MWGGMSTNENVYVCVFVCYFVILITSSAIHYLMFVCALVSFCFLRYLCLICILIQNRMSGNNDRWVMKGRVWDGSACLILDPSQIKINSFIHSFNPNFIKCEMYTTHNKYLLWLPFFLLLQTQYDGAYCQLGICSRQMRCHCTTGTVWLQLQSKLWNLMAVFLQSYP